MMKKYILSLVMVAAAVLQVQAYEYFTIFFANGTKSRPFYATDVDSIAYSKVGVDSLEYAEWKVQEIWTADSVYRYWLADIENISFTDVDETKVAEDIVAANDVVAPLFAECETIDELATHLSEIRASDAVEDAWADNQTLFIKIKDYGTITYLYPPKWESGTLPFNVPSAMPAKQLPKIAPPHEHTDANNMCIFFQPYRDKRPFMTRADSVADKLATWYKIMGKSCKVYKEVVKPDFFINNIFDYDQVFLITHGEYDEKSNLHWIYTSDEVFSCKKDGILSFTPSTILEFLLKQVTRSNDQISIGALPEIRNGITYIVYYKKVSERYIATADKRFPNKGSMIFNTACQSLKGADDKDNDALANAFIEKGASCYLGYNETNGVGHTGGMWFYGFLLNACTVKSAYNYIPSDCKYDQKYGAHLRIIRSSDSVSNYCIAKPKTLPIDNVTIEGAEYKQLKGQIAMLDSSMSMVYQFGFLLMKSSSSQTVTQITIDDVKANKAEKDSVAGEFNSDACMFELKYAITKTLGAGKYSYCAYMFDGDSYCYGNIESFTIDVNICPDDNHPHAIDLGLPSGTKWACCNVGATCPEEYGGYYAWGETEEKSVYSPYTYKYWHDADGDGNADWWDSPEWTYLGDDISGTNYDVAHVKWGETWHMPTLTQIDELIRYCTWSDGFKSLNGVKCRVVAGPNGGTIYLPVAGYRSDSYLKDADSQGRYWSSVPGPEYAGSAYFLHLDGLHSTYLHWYHSARMGRFIGQSVRPVMEY